jgi:alpha-ribazole phosphatase
VAKTGAVVTRVFCGLAQKLGRIAGSGDTVKEEVPELAAPAESETDSLETLRTRRILLLRHGRTKANEEHLYCGSTDLPLSEEGRALLARKRGTYGTDWESFYTSGLSRTRETLELIFGEQRTAKEEPDLREMDFGAFDGRGWWEMENDADYRSWVDGGCLGQCPGGEDRASCSARVCAAFARILDENLRDCRTDDLFIVAHGGTQMAVLEEWGRPARDYYAWQTPCGWCWCLETPPEPGAWRREGLGAVGRHSFLREDPAPADLKK